MSFRGDNDLQHSDEFRIEYRRQTPAMRRRPQRSSNSRGANSTGGYNGMHRRRRRRYTW